MNKNIVICSDGTGNTTIKGRGTNVFKMFESIDLNGHRFDPELDPQVAIYDDGVGTEDFKPLKILGGVTGWGLSRNVKQLYKELCRIYDPGDRIFLFGFSRGAFTVRTLAGIITKCGMIDTVIYPFKFPNQRLSEHVKHAYHALAIDDERHSFHPLLWDQSIPSENKNQKIEQIWFAGAHSNVGGGYPKQGMSLVPLDWLMEK